MSILLPKRQILGVVLLISPLSLSSLMYHFHHVESITAKASILSPLSARLSSGVSVCGVGERTQRPLSGLPGRQQPDPNWTQDNRHGGDGGGVS